MVKQPEANIKYKTNAIADFYSIHRNKWSDIYPSEKFIFGKVAREAKHLGNILDVGCAAGGLYRALAEHFSINSYIGVDINAKAIEAAKSNEKSSASGLTQFLCEDILKVASLPVDKFNNVFSLSCADWNVSTIDIIKTCWNYVCPDGNFILTLRLTDQLSLIDIQQSYQYIFFGDILPEHTEALEKAPYVVFNIKDALTLLSSLRPRPEKITAYGYWGKPSNSAITKYERLCFTALSVKKNRNDAMEVSEDTIQTEFYLPLNLFF